MALRASDANCRVGTNPAERAASARENIDEPEISVRSRSKNAAIGPELATPVYSLMGSRSPYSATPDP